MKAGVIYTANVISICMSSKVDKPLYLSNSSQSECHVLYNCRQNIELSNSAMMTEEQVVKARKKSRACKRRDRKDVEII